MNAIELLKQQHEKTTKTLEKMSAGGGGAAEVRALANELVAHMVIEEHIFYPRVKELMNDMIDESFEEHAVARFELARLLKASDTERKTRALVLKELLGHHIEEEEEEMFPKVKKSLPAEELTRLGERMLAAFEKSVEKGFDAFFEPEQPARTRAPLANGTGSAQARH